MWKITPIDVGDITYDKSEATIRRGMGQKVHEKFVAWYLTDGKKHVLVDTGLPDLEHSRKYHPYIDPRISEKQLITNALKEIGVNPDDIELVILTHLHWDHAGGMQYFKNAQFIVSQAELQYAVDPCPIHYAGYEAAQSGLTPMFLTVLPQTKTIPMEEIELLPGLTVFPTPGHTVGSISVAADTSDGPYVITGDAVACYENIEGDPACGLKYIPTGIYHNILDTWNSMERIMEKAKFRADHVLPGHDSKVFNQKCYPAK